MIESIETGSTIAVRSTMPFFTVRNFRGGVSPEEYFGEDRGHLHTGYCDIHWEPFRVLKTIERNLPFYVPQGRGRIDSVIEVPNERFWQQLKEKLAGRKPLLIVHGYNINFRKNMLRGRLFQANTQMDDRLLLFNWPSAGRTVEYTRDESNMEWSVHYLKQVILTLLQHFGPGGVDLAAHSLGARGLHAALVGLSPTNRGLLAGNVIFFAADIDADFFRQNLGGMQSTCNKITVYVSDSDRALLLSREVHGYPRLGEAGVHLHHLAGVDFIDTSRLTVQRVSGHLYHVDNVWVSADLRLLLHDRLGPEKRQRLTKSEVIVGTNYWYINAQ